MSETSKLWERKERGEITLTVDVKDGRSLRRGWRAVQRQIKPAKENDGCKASALGHPHLVTSDSVQ